MKCLNVLSLILILVGAINCGLWGFFQFDLVAWVAGGNTTGFARFIYAVVGLAGVWGLGFLGKCKALCACKSDDHHKGSGGGCCRM